MTQDYELRVVVDDALHNTSRFTFSQIARHLREDYGEVGMAKVLEDRCWELETALGWIKTAKDPHNAPRH